MPKSIGCIAAICATPPESLEKLPFLSRPLPTDERQKTLTIHRIACSLLPTPWATGGEVDAI